MPTQAKRAFDVNLQRASYFLDIHEWEKKGAGAPRLPFRELPRGAVVFAIGALDAYLCEVSAEVMVRDLETTLGSPKAREVLKRIQSDIPTLGLEIAVIPDQQARRQCLRDAVVDYFHNRVSMHGSKAAADTAGRIGAHAADLWSALGSQDHKDAQKELDRWTATRHQIVHQGKKPQVRREDARACIELVRAIALALDALATN